MKIIQYLFACKQILYYICKLLIYKYSYKQLYFQ